MSDSYETTDGAGRWQRHFMIPRYYWFHIGTRLSHVWFARRAGAYRIPFSEPFSLN